MMDRPSPAELASWLKDSLSDALDQRFGKLEISLLSQAIDVPDGTTVLRLCDAEGRPRAVVLCSAPASPGMVHRAVSRARQAKAALGPSLGAAILEPLMVGSVHGLSYAVMPYCDNLSKFRPVWWVQRALLRPVIFRWLSQATQRTVREVEPTDIQRAFTVPLREIANHGHLDQRIRRGAAQALERLNDRIWRPKFVLMHADFWAGNILIRPPDPDGEKHYWRDRFTIIDWPGSETNGYAILDLIRMSRSMSMGPSVLRREVVDHCRMLECDTTDAMSYLLAALGHVLLNLEYFPIEAYARMAESCFATLDESVSS